MLLILDSALPHGIGLTCAGSKRMSPESKERGLYSSLGFLPCSVHDIVCEEAGMGVGSCHSMRQPRQLCEEVHMSRNSSLLCHHE